jgi:hypothetical protein
MASHGDVYAVATMVKRFDEGFVGEVRCGRELGIVSRGALDAGRRLNALLD